MNSQLLHYLDKYFKGDIGLYEGAQVDIVTHFREKFGVAVRQEKNLFQFKYDMLEAKFSYPLVHECRGHILRFHVANNKWEFVSRPFDKFFNQHEGYCQIFAEKDFKPLINQLAFIEKIDGSCIQVFYDWETMIWRATTLGTITPYKVGETEMNFDTLFWKTIGISPVDMMSFGHLNYTYVFELACEENRVVALYPNNFVALLCIRDNSTGSYVDRNNMQYFIDRMYRLKGVNPKNLRLPHIKFMYEVSITSLDEAKQWIEKESDNIDETKVVQEMIQTKFAGKTFANQKDYAMCVLESVPKRYSSFFFGNKEKILNSNTDHFELFKFWLKSNYSKFDWKSEIKGESSCPM